MINNLEQTLDKFKKYRKKGVYLDLDQSNPEDDYYYLDCIPIDEPMNKVFEQ